MKTFKQFINENGRYVVPSVSVGIEREKHSVFKDGKHVINPLSVGIHDDTVEEMYHPETDMKNMYTLDQCKLNDRLIAHHGYSHSGSTADNAKALYRYTVKSSPLNEYLHKKHLGTLIPSREDAEHEEHIKQLDKAFSEAKPSPEEYYAYSGIRFNPEDLINDQQRGAGRKAAQLKGEEEDHLKLHFPSIVSTSISPHRAVSFSRPDTEGYRHMIKFRIPKGAKGMPHVAGISNFSTELETAVERGKNVRLHKVPEISDHPKFGKVKIWHAEFED